MEKLGNTINEEEEKKSTVGEQTLLFMDLALDQVYFTCSARLLYGV